MDISGSIWSNITGCKYYQAFESTSTKELLQKFYENKYTNESLKNLIYDFTRGYMPVITEVVRAADGHSNTHVFTIDGEYNEWENPKTEQLCDVLLGLLMGYNKKKIRLTGMRKMYENYCKIVQGSLAYQESVLRLIPRFPELLEWIFYSLYRIKADKAQNNIPLQIAAYEEYTMRKYVYHLILLWMFKPMVDLQNNRIHGKGAIVENSVFCDVLKILYDENLSDTETATELLAMFLPEIERDNAEALVALRYRQQYLDGNCSYSGLSEIEEIIYLVSFITLMYIEYLGYTTLISSETDSKFKTCLQSLIRGFYNRMIEAGADERVCFITSQQSSNELNYGSTEEKDYAIKMQQNAINEIIGQTSDSKEIDLSTIVRHTMTDRVCRKGYLMSEFSSGQYKGYFSDGMIDYDIQEVLTCYGDVIFYLTQNDNQLSLSIDDYSFSHSYHTKSITIFTVEDRWGSENGYFGVDVSRTMFLKTLVDGYYLIKKRYLDLIQDSEKTQTYHPAIELSSLCVSPETLSIIGDENGHRPTITDMEPEDLPAYCETGYYINDSTIIHNQGLKSDCLSAVIPKDRVIYPIEIEYESEEEKQKYYRATISPEEYKKLSHMISTQPTKKVYMGDEPDKNSKARSMLRTEDIMSPEEYQTFSQMVSAVLSLKYSKNEKAKEDREAELKRAYSFNMALEPAEVLVYSRGDSPVSADVIQQDVVCVQVSVDANNCWSGKIDDKFTASLVNANKIIIETIDKLFTGEVKPQDSDPNWVRQARKRLTEKMETETESEAEDKVDESTEPVETEQPVEAQPEVQEEEDIKEITSMRGNIYTSETLKLAYNSKIISQKKNVDYDGPRVNLSDEYFDRLVNNQDSPAQVEVDDRLMIYDPVADFFEFVGGDL